MNSLIRAAAFSVAFILFNVGSSSADDFKHSDSISANEQATGSQQDLTNLSSYLENATELILSGETEGIYIERDDDKKIKLKVCYSSSFCVRVIYDRKTGKVTLKIPYGLLTLTYHVECDDSGECIITDDFGNEVCSSAKRDDGATVLACDYWTFNKTFTVWFNEQDELCTDNGTDVICQEVDWIKEPPIGPIVHLIFNPFIEFPDDWLDEDDPCNNVLPQSQQPSSPLIMLGDGSAPAMLSELNCMRTN